MNFKDAAKPYICYTMYKMKRRADTSGFTIVELLIVVVVIAILAAITIVAYNGINQRANDSSVKNIVSQAFKKVETYKTTDDTYPADLLAAGVPTASGVTFDFRTYGYGACVSATKGTSIFHVSTDNPGATYGTCGQVKVEYFNNTSLSGNPALVRYEDRIDNVWGTASPGPGVNADNFSARHTSYVIPPVTGTYTFSTYVDDGERVWVNGTLLGDYFAAGPCCTTRTLPTTINLTAGQAVPVIVEAREGGGGAAMRLYWAYPGQTIILIPTSAYVRTN